MWRNIVDAEVFQAVQVEKARRVNIETSSDTPKGKSAHYRFKAIPNIVGMAKFTRVAFYKDIFIAIKVKGC